MSIWSISTWIFALSCLRCTCSWIVVPFPTLATPRLHAHKANTEPHLYVALYKPALTLCTFQNDRESAKRHHRLERDTLGSLGLPEGLHPCGRLDRDSEGLLLLTTDGLFTSRVCDNRQADKLCKRYLVRVRNVPSNATMEKIRMGGLSIRGALTRPPESAILLPPFCTGNHTTEYKLENFPKPVSGMEDRKGQYAWLEIVLTEGRNRQVRRITAHAGHPTVRLVRVSVGNLSLEDLNLYEPGQWCLVDKEAVLGTTP